DGSRALGTQIMSSALSKELRIKDNARSLPIRKDDKAHVVRTSTRAGREKSPRCTTRSGSFTLTVASATSGTAQRYPSAHTPVTLSLL
ncbi:hypothetical protein C8R44DRAFT_920923, partial [Mycena epipterygia]